MTIPKDEGKIAEQEQQQGAMKKVDPVNKKMKILHLEDLSSDVELIGNALKRGGIDFERIVVETKEQFLNALESFVPDIILADHALPSFDSHEALSIVLTKGIDIPFLLITGAMSDEFAADIIKRGADDYILKDRLNRLPAAVQSSLEKFRIRKVQKKIREELLISEAQFRGAFEFSAIGMALVSTSGLWLKINNALCNMLGYDAGELLCRTFADITHPQDLELDLLQMRQILRREIESYQMEKRYFNRNGNIVWVLLNVSLVTDQQGAPVHFIFQIENITKRKETETALQQINQELTAIFDSVHVSIIGTDTKGVITHFSKGAEAMLGYSATEMIGHFTPAIFLSPQEMKDREQEITALFGKEGNDSEVLKELTRQHRHESRDWTYVRKDGTTLPVQLVVTATTNERGQINGFLGIATDITIRKEVEDARHKYAILESKSKEMEQFAYIASHDLREPLLGIQSYISLIMEEIHADFDKELRGYLNNITAAASHMDILLKGLLDYSLLSSVTKPGPADMNKYMQDVMEMLEPLINESGAFIEVGELPVLVTCRPEMKQVFYHLLKNALTFRRSGVHARVRISAVKKNNGWLFSFTDNGMGIAPHQVEKVFVIFQRLHNRDEYPGTGIGLAHCKRIIELQGGTIWVEPGPEGGSSFCFSLAES